MTDPPEDRGGVRSGRTGEGDREIPGRTTVWSALGRIFSVEITGPGVPIRHLFRIHPASDYSLSFREIIPQIRLEIGRYHLLQSRETSLNDFFGRNNGPSEKHVDKVFISAIRFGRVTQTRPEQVLVWAC